MRENPPADRYLLLRRQHAYYTAKLRRTETNLRNLDLVHAGGQPVKSRDGTKRPSPASRNQYT